MILPLYPLVIGAAMGPKAGIPVATVLYLIGLKYFLLARREGEPSLPAEEPAAPDS